MDPGHHGRGTPDVVGPASVDGPESLDSGCSAPLRTADAGPWPGVNRPFVRSARDQLTAPGGDDRRRWAVATPLHHFSRADCAGFRCRRTERLDDRRRDVRHAVRRRPDGDRHLHHRAAPLARRPGHRVRPRPGRSRRRAGCAAPPCVRAGRRLAPRTGPTGDQRDESLPWTASGVLSRIVARVSSRRAWGGVRTHTPGAGARGSGRAMGAPAQVVVRCNAPHSNRSVSMISSRPARRAGRIDATAATTAVTTARGASSIHGNA